MTDPLQRELARYLRQRLEMGQDPVVLAALDRVEAMELVERPVGGAPAAASGPGGPDVQRTLGDETPAPPPGSPATATPPGGAATAGAGLTDEEIAAVGEYEVLRDAALSCTRCRLCETRTQVVFSDGNPNARLVVVGEAPGANEDRTGLPFVGQAGKLLDLLLAAVGLSRKDSVYICNVLKCRPPGNRNPNPDEIQLCSPYLRRQIGLVAPQAILAVGTFSAQLLTGLNRPLGKLRGEVYSYEGVPLVVSYHPAALLRNSGWTRATWDDLQLLRQVLDGT